MTDRREYYKKYNEEHKEHKRQYMAERYAMKKDEILTKNNAWKDAHPERLKDKTTCDVCGSEVTRHHLARHKRTNKCVNHKE